MQVETGPTYTIHTKDQLVDFVSFQVHPDHVDNVRDVLTIATDLCQKGLLSDTIEYKEDLYLVYQLHKKRLLNYIKVWKEL